MTVIIYCHFAIGTTSSPFRLPKEAKTISRHTPAPSNNFYVRECFIAGVPLSLHIDQEFSTKIRILRIVSVITQ
jgi:hypothetical protein